MSTAAGFCESAVEAAACELVAVAPELIGAKLTPRALAGAGISCAKMAHTGAEHCMKTKLLPAAGFLASVSVAGNGLGWPV